MVAMALLAFSVLTLLPPKNAEALTPGIGAPTPVYRWWHNGDQDWISVPTHGSQITAPALTSSGYTKHATPQFYVSMIGTPDPNMVAVYRWWHGANKDWMDVRNGSPSDAQMTATGYTGKVFLYYAYTNSAAGRVAINRWWSAPDKDWVTLAQNEMSDADLLARGYTNKTLIAYASATRSPTGEMGYFNLGTPQSAVVPTSMYPGGLNEPHTFSVVDVNPTRNPNINRGYRYLGYMGHVECPDLNDGYQPGDRGGIYVARANSLDAPTWVQDTVAPKFSTPAPPCRWASAIVNESSKVHLVVSQEYNKYITGQTSTDANGMTFGAPITFVKEQNPAIQNGNPTLFRDPNTRMFHLYWYRLALNGMFEIRVKSSMTFAGLVGSGPADIGQLVAYSPETTAAPHVMYANNKYYLAVETYEGDDYANGTPKRWKTRILTSTSPTGRFYEIPGNPTYSEGAACVFQHVSGNELHSYYCKGNVSSTGFTWTLDHVKGNLLSPN